MRQMIAKCNCDICEKEMTDYEYSKSPRITIRVDMPNPSGGCGECASIDKKICDKCAEKYGIENKEEYHKYIYSQNKLRQSINNNFKAMLNILKKKM